MVIDCLAFSIYYKFRVLDRQTCNNFSLAHISGPLQTDTMICQANSNHSQPFFEFILMYHFILFHKKIIHIATILVSCHLGNLQATDSKKNEITTFVMKSTNPHLPDRVDFKHQFVKFKAGRGI